MARLTQAHDVRHWRICEHCRQPGDARAMVLVWNANYHGRCYIAVNGLERLLKLPADQREKLALDDVGSGVMAQLIAIGER